MQILVIDDNENSLQSLCLLLKDLGHEPIGIQEPTKALKKLRTSFFPLIITDIRMPDIDGLTLLSLIKNDPQTSKSDVVIITGHGDMATAVDALRKGAYDYLNKPINARELAAVVERSAEHQALLMENYELRNNLEEEVSRATEELKRDLEQARHRLREVEGIGLVIAESSAMQRILHEALILHGDPSVPVLIEGETGTGKEIVARYIHFGEDGVDLPFMDINCAAIPSELFESELFGYEPGAFTGSKAAGSSGKLEQAGKGSVFLDEVAEMPMSLQPKLLRVLEDRTFYRVGGVKKREFSARVICAGNRNMAEMIEKGTFRRDLYHRLRVGYIRIPPLRERPEDIAPLAEHFLRRETARKKKNFTSIAPTALTALKQYPWPGNIREMENTIERAVLMHDGPILSLEQLQFQEIEAAKGYISIGRRSTDILGTLPYQSSSQPDPHTQNYDGSGQISDLQNINLSISNGQGFAGLTLPEENIDLDALMDDIIMAALERFKGNKSKTAEYLGMSRFALHRRLQAKEK